MIEGPWNPWWEGETEEAPMSDAADRILAGWPDASDAIACAKRVRELEAVLAEVRFNEAVTHRELSRYRPRWEDAPEWATECAIVWRSDESDIEAIHTERRPEDE